MSDSEPEQRKVELGPFFLAGVVMLAYGLLRRRTLVAAAGLGAIWLDQRSKLGRSLKEKARAKYMTVQYVEAGTGARRTSVDVAAQPGDVAERAHEGSPDSPNSRSAHSGQKA